MTGQGEHRASFLGTLRSELDESNSDLDEAFETLAALCSAARAAYLDFRLNPERAATLFQMLRLTANDGHEWTVGPTSGLWYRRMVGTQEWRKAAIPVGLAPVYTEEPAWLTEGIGEYLMAQDLDASGGERRQAAEEHSFTSLLPGGYGDPSTAAPLAAGAPLPLPEVGGADDSSDWLLGEWQDFDRNLDELRHIRATSDEDDLDVVAPVMPPRLPDDWDADKALSEALSAPEVIVARDGGAPFEGSWEPRERGEYVSPESFFLPPEER